MRAGLAQMVEQRFCKPKVAGSIPATGTTDLSFFINILEPTNAVFIVAQFPGDRALVRISSRTGDGSLSDFA